MKFLANMNRVIFIAIFFILHVTSAQEVDVFDADSHEPIVNVVVYNNDRSKTALSDIDGTCDLSVFDANERITFKHLSYEIRRSTKAQIAKQGHRIFLIMKAEQLDEVVMSISKWEQQKKDIPHKIATIDARSIAFSNPQTAADLLQNSGKVFVQKSQLGGGSPMIRGFATNRLLLSVDGVRMNNAIFRGGNIQNVISIDPYSIKNTEIIFGPGSVIYGSDAIGGVMNFYTKNAQLSQGDSLFYSGNANYRFASANSENTMHFDVNLGFKKWAFVTSISSWDYDNLRQGSHGPEDYIKDYYVQSQDSTDVVITQEDKLLQIPSAFSQINMMQKIRFQPNERWDFQYGFHFSETSPYGRYDRNQSA